ncbi:MAG: helix-turn-helix domain-containing protein [Firmicutes bacterium]|nr:helix-turn-helix domain-containing protein [Bacillota bacterium]
MKFGNILRELRQEKNLSQVQLANKTGLSKSAIACWELSQSEPTAGALIILAEFFDVSVDELLGRKDYLR